MKREHLIRGFARLAESKSRVFIWLPAAAIILTICGIGIAWLAGSFREPRPPVFTTTEPTTAASIDPSMEQSTVDSLAELNGVALPAGRRSRNQHGSLVF